MASEYPFYTPYQFAGNMPVWCIDLDGLEPIVASKYSTLEALKKTINIKYTFFEVQNTCVSMVTLVHKYKDKTLTTTMTNLGSSQESLKTFWGKVSYASTHSPFTTLALNKINIMSYKKENKQGLAFGSMGDEMIQRTKSKLRDPEGLKNTMLHVNGQALITVLFGKDVANEAGFLHERGQKSLTNGMFFSKNEEKAAIDNYADMINNQWGQLWGEELMKELNISSSTEWTNDITAKFLNGLQKRYTETMGIEFKKEFKASDEFVQQYTEFINENK